MSLNCAEIEKITGTLKKNVVIKSIYHTDKNALVIETYDKESNYKILIDTSDRFNHLCMLPDDEITSQKKQTPLKKNLRFGQFLNSQFAGARIKNIFQHALSRIVVFEIEKNSISFRLVCRIWGTASNIMLLDNENTIIETLKRFPKMDEWPSEEFVFPEKNAKSDGYKVRNEFECDDINAAVYHYFKTLREQGEFERLKVKIETHIKKELSILKEQLGKIDKNTRSDYAEEYYKKGELLKSNIYKIKKGDKSVMALDYSDNSEVLIVISPELGPSENVEKYFTRYKKIKDGISRWNIQKNNIEEKIDQYENILRIVEGTKLLEKMNEIHDKVFSGKLSKIAGKSGDKEKTPGRKFLLSNGYVAYVSKSSKDADKLLTLVASGNDYWFHIRDYAGSHVVVKEIKNSVIPDEVKIEASTLALYYSKGRNSDEGDIYFTRVKYLHKGKNSPSGLVVPTQEKNIKVIFDRNILDKIFARLNEE